MEPLPLGDVMSTFEFPPSPLPRKPYRFGESGLTADAAEDIVVSRLKIMGIEAFRGRPGQPGFDVLAAVPEAGRCCRIQVKSRWTGPVAEFLVGDLNGCDFVAFVSPNLKDEQRAFINPHVFVFPSDVLRPLVRDATTVPKVRLADIPGRRFFSPMDHITLGMTLVEGSELPSDYWGYLDAWIFVARHLKGLDDPPPPRLACVRSPICAPRSAHRS